MLFCFAVMSPGITQTGLQLTVKPRMTLIDLLILPQPSSHGLRLEV